MALAAEVGGEAGAERTLTAASRPRVANPPTPDSRVVLDWLRWRLGEGEFKKFGPHDMKNRPELPFGGKGQAPVPPWAWTKAKQFVAARHGPHP